MMSLIARERLQLPILITHILLGVLVTYFPSGLIIWIYLVVFSALFEALSNGNKTGAIHFFIAYYLGMEILCRIAKLSPAVPYESGKYFFFLFLVAGIVLDNKESRTRIGWIILLLLIPSFFILPASTSYKDIVFNELGIINLALGLIYFAKIRLSINEIRTLFRVVILGIVPVLVSVILRTPDFDDIKFTLYANFETSGGFGSNQVSTLLSLGFLLTAFSLLFGLRIFKFTWITSLLMILFFFRALLTFSRGGLIGAVVVLFLIWLTAFIAYNNILPKGLTLTRVSVGLIVLIVVFFQANEITSNNLLLRYQGETQSTLSGRREKDLSLLTSNRLDIILSDIRIWNDNFFLGIGPGMSKYERSSLSYDAVTAHTELSRLLSEHGVFGFVICLTLLFYPIKKFFSEKIPLRRLLQVCFFGYAIFTSFHSAMRTNVTPFLFSAAILSVAKTKKKNEKPVSVHWKSTSEVRV